MTFQVSEYFRKQIEKSKKLEAIWIKSRRDELTKFPNHYIKIMDEIIQDEKRRRGLNE